MVSLSSGLRRLKLFITFKMNPDVSIGAAEPFNEYFFPGHLINKSEPIAPPESHSPHWLLARMADNTRARESVGSISITEISYYKDKEAAQHEFLVFRIEDSRRPLANYIKIDRHPPKGKEQNTPPSPTDNEAAPAEPPAREHSGSTAASLWHTTTTQPYLISSSSLPSLDTQNALDMVHISNSGSLRSIVDQNASTRLGVIKVSRDETVKKPTLEDILLIAELVSGTQPHYRLLRAQCYCSKDRLWGDNIELTERQTFASMTAGYLSKLDAFEKSIAEKKRSFIHASEERAIRAEQEVIRLKEEIARGKEAAPTAVVQESLEMPDLQSSVVDNQP
ncbi:ubiquitin carboxyl-terminal hydrolase [Ceratobasidium sp. AG-Ba]|nr:ubiquitin carboxyl-terminal hydrolase [Ceratobasidium sp. AG-Ba]